MKKFILGFALLSSLSAFAGFDFTQFEKDLDIILNRAGMETDLHFACSSEGKKQTNKMIQAIKTKAQNLPIENSQQVADDLENNYKGVFNCEENIQKALKMGFTKNEIDRAIERSKKRNAQNTGKSTIDFDALERDLDVMFSNM